MKIYTTMKSNNITTDRTLNALRRHFKGTFLLLSLLTFGIGQTWGTDWSIAGSMNSWNVNTNKRTNTGTISITLAANTSYTFKIVKDGSTWYGNNGTMTRANCSGWTFSTSDGNCTISTDKAGTYVFNISNATPTLTVTYPDPTYYVAGGMNNWSTSDNPFVDGKVSFDLTSGTTTEFKIYKDVGGVYYGNDGTMTSTNCTNWDFSSSAGNAKITANITGTYVFELVNNTPRITVHYPVGVTWSATSVYSGSSSTLTASASNLASGKSLKYEVFAGATATGTAVATYNTTTSAATDSHAFNITPSFGASDTRKQYTVKITYNSSQTATYTSYIYRKWDIYVHDVNSWGQMKLYMWDGSTNSNATYPGAACSAYNSSSSWYTVTLDGRYDNGFVLSANGDATKTVDHSMNIATYGSGTFWYVSAYVSGTLTSISVTDPTVSAPTLEKAGANQLTLKGQVTNCGGDGLTAADMKAVGFRIGSTDYPADCTDGTYFYKTITGLTANNAYSVKAYAENIHGRTNSSTASHSTMATTATHTLKIQVRNGVIPYVYAFSNIACGSILNNAAWPGVAATRIIDGTEHDWYSYTLHEQYDKFVIVLSDQSKQTDDIINTKADICCWYDDSQSSQSGRYGTMTCPYTEPQLMIETTAGGGSFTYHEMSTTPSISKTVSLAANSTYKFKIVYNAEWYGKASTTITRGANSASGLNAGSGDNLNINITTDIAGSYTFTFTASGTITVTYPAAYTVTYNANGATGGNVPEGSGTTYYASGSNVTLATNTGILYKTGNAFNGWNTADNGGGTHYASGGTLSSISANKTLYAEWKANDNHMYFYNKDNWPAVAAYMWSAVNDPEQSYPGRTMSPHQGKVYKIDYRSDVQQNVVFNNNYTGSGTEYKTGDLTIADGQSGDHWFYNDADKLVNTGGIHHGWSQYIMVAEFPTSTVAAVVGERITLSPVLAWAEDVTFNDIEITSTRTSGDASVNAIISGTNIIVSGTTANTSATFTITYRYSTTTITKTLTVNIKNGIVIQSKVPQDDNHWVYSNVMKLHYWGTGISDGDVTMAWVKADNDYTYFQTFVPLGTDNKINFLFYYDYMNMSEMWRQTTNITNVTTAGCYEIKHNNGLDAQRTWARSGDNCVDTWQVEITMGSGDIFTSNVVDNSTDIISFFAPSNANESHTYRQGVVTLEHNGATVATIPAATFTQSGVYTAKVNTSTPGLTNVALYTGNYYIRTDASSGGWDNYKTDPLNKMTNFNRNTNFPNETFSYYWVDNVAKTPGDPVNIKATVANDYNPVLTNFSIDESVAREEHGINLRFGYEPTTNELVRGILRGSNENNFLNVIDGNDNVYRDAECTVLMNEDMYADHPDYLKMLDKSNWVYEINAYAKIDASHRAATVYLKSYFNGIHYLLGMVKDEDGRDTDTPIKLPIIATGSTYDTYSLRVVYDFKTNRLFAAWAPADISISSNMNVDADVMFLRHEQGDVSQISFANTSAKVTELNKAIFAVEIADDRSTSLGNRELHYFFSLPFDCYVKDIFGIGGFMEYWGIQYYDGAERARIGWFVETPTFWKWLGENDLLEAGKGYLLSIDKKALQTGDQWKSVHFMDFVNGVWTDQGEFSILTLYFPSAGSGFSMGSATATGATKIIEYPNEPCSIKRDDRDQKDSNWKCIGTPGYKNMTMTGYTATSPAPPVWDGHTPPNFLYEFNEQTTSATYAKGTYTVRNGQTWTYHAFHSYMVQYAGTINWGDYTAGNGPSHIVARRAPQNEMSQATNVEIDLLSEDSTSLDRTFVWLREDATAGYDQNYDLNKMVESYANQIYSLSDHDIPFAANVMPYETDTVRLVVNIVNPGEFTFSMLKDEHFGLTPILYDMYKSERIDLTSADYTVELDYGKYTDRFFLLFSPVKPVATAIETTEDGTQNVLSGEAIYDVLGRRVSTVTPGHLYIVNGEKRIAQ